MIEYRDSITGITAEQLEGFFGGWANPPAPATHLRILQRADFVALALDDETNQVVGFVYAISDGVLAAYIPLIEVLVEYQGEGIGSTLLQQIREQLGDFYIVDLICDIGQQGFYAQAGFKPATGAMLRNYDRQAGRDA